MTLVLWPGAHQIAELQGTGEACRTAHGNYIVACFQIPGAAQIRDFHSLHGTVIHSRQIHAYNSQICYPVIILQNRFLAGSIYKGDL